MDGFYFYAPCVVSDFTKFLCEGLLGEQDEDLEQILVQVQEKMKARRVQYTTLPEDGKYFPILDLGQTIITLVYIRIKFINIHVQCPNSSGLSGRA